MREIFSLRFFAAIAAVFGLFVVLNIVVVGRDTIASTDAESPIPRRIDVASPIQLSIRAASGSDLVVVDGVVEAPVTFILENRARATVVPGTHGELDCSLQALPGSCVFFAQSLGDAVVWFEVLPKRPDDTVVLPAIDDLGRDTAVLVNGWRVPYAPRLERRCERDFDSYRQLRAELGDRFNSIYSLEEQRLIAVECLD
jgi:hypothetical protein